MLKVVRSGPILRVSLNRPEVRNALNEELIGSLYELFSNLSQEIRVVVLSGEGASFCAGGDLEWMRRAAGYTEVENERDALKIGRLWASIQNCHALTIASVHGAAFGGGGGLVATVDIAIATEETKFAFSEVKLGLIPATISPFVIDKIGKGHARALFATGEVFSAHHALTIGLVHEVVKAVEMDAALNKRIRAALQVGPKALHHSKVLVHDHPITMDDAAKRLAVTRAGEEAKEGISAFLEKRPASFVESLPDDFEDEGKSV